MGWAVDKWCEAMETVMRHERRRSIGYQQRKGKREEGNTMEIRYERIIRTAMATHANAT
jgi:hypothetical protein